MYFLTVAGIWAVAVAPPAGIQVTKIGSYLRGRRLVDGLTGVFFAGFGVRLLLSQR